MRVRRHSHVALLSRAWELAGDVTAYDACYLVLAEELGARLVTCDAKLAGVPGCRAEVDVVG